MKRILALLLICAMAFVLAACGSSQVNGGTSKMTMGTGGPTGTYYIYGGVISQYILDDAGISVNVVSTDGSKANIVGIDYGDYQLATVQSDVMAYAWEGSSSFAQEGKIQSFRVVCGLYAEAVQLVTMDPQIKTVADLKGKNVSIGAPGSGVYFNAIDVLAAAGLTENDIRPQYQSNIDSADALKDGKIDAAFFVAAVPMPTVVELCTHYDAYVIPLDGEISKRMIERCPFYTVCQIPAGTYRGQTEPVNTVAVKATLITDADASEDDIYHLTAAIFENSQNITKEHAKGAELTLQNATSGMTVPFHPGAARYFAEKGIQVEAG